MNKRGDARCITKTLSYLRRGARELVIWENNYFRRYLGQKRAQAAAERCPDGGGLRLRGGAKNLRPKRRNIRETPFVYTGAVRYATALGEIQKKPRGGSRGAMTRSLSGR